MAPTARLQRTTAEETHIRTSLNLSYDIPPYPIFFKVDIPLDIIATIQRFSNALGINYVLIPKITSPVGYRQIALDRQHIWPMFLVYDGSGNFLCYGIEDHEMEGIPFLPRSLRSYTLHGLLGDSDYQDYADTYHNLNQPLAL